MEASLNRLRWANSGSRLPGQADRAKVFGRDLRSVRIATTIDLLASREFT
jgi:hypothetical protein